MGERLLDLMGQETSVISPSSLNSSHMIQLLLETKPMGLD